MVAKPQPTADARLSEMLAVKPTLTTASFNPTPSQLEWFSELLLTI
jgi:hypothetical protein